MSHCPKVPTSYDIDKEEEEANKLENEEIAAIPSCVDDVLEYTATKHLLSKWRMLKRVKQMFQEQVINKKRECFRDDILKNMKVRIVQMPEEERKVWITKILRLAFLDKLREIRDIKRARQAMLNDILVTSDGKKRDELLRKLAQLKDLYDMKEMDDVNQILELKKTKQDRKKKKAKQMEMKIRLNRLKLIKEIRAKEERQLRHEKVEQLKEILTVKKNWQEEMVMKIDEVVRMLAEDLVRLEDRKEWHDRVQAEIEREKQRIEEEIIQEREAEERAELLRKEKEMTNLKKKQKVKEIETWKKEMKVRVWKLDKLKKFQQFLETRYSKAEGDENLFFRKIFDKLIASDRKKIDVDPWDVKPKLGEQEAEVDARRKMDNWIQGIISSTKQKVVNKVKLKKYLEAMECPKLDRLVSYVKRIPSITNFMFVIRGRIMRNSFPDEKKQYIAREFNKIMGKTKVDIRDIDPTDQLLGVQLTTTHHDVYFGTGDEYLTVMEQVIVPHEEACQDKTDVLCLTIQERDKMLELIKQRQQSRKVIKESRLEEYEAFGNRKALDAAWMKYVKRAYEEAVRNLKDCRRVGEDVVKIEVQPPGKEDTTAQSTLGNDTTERGGGSLGYSMLLTEDQIQALMMNASSALSTKEKPKLNYDKAMDKRVERLVSMVKVKEGDDVGGKGNYYKMQQKELRDILEKEKAVRQHMIKDLPASSEEDF